MEEKDGIEKTRKISMRIEPHLDGGTYANVFSLLNSANEFIIDFGLLVPTTGSVRISARVILNPLIAKQLALSLTEGVKNFEAKFGEIKIDRASHNFGSQILN